MAGVEAWALRRARLDPELPPGLQPQSPCPAGVRGAVRFPGLPYVCPAQNLSVSDSSAIALSPKLSVRRGKDRML